MIVSQAEVDLIRGPTRRRMMRLPVDPKKRCPVKYGHSYQMRVRGSRLFEQVTVIAPVHSERLEALSASHARKEGYGGVTGALDAWRAAYGEPAANQEVWVIAFARGDHSAFMLQDETLFLKPTGGYTTRRDELHAGAVLDPTLTKRFAAEARAATLAKRQAPQREALDRAQAECDTLRSTMLAMKTRNLLKRTERNIATMHKQLQEEVLLHSDVLASASGSAHSPDRHAPSGTVASPQEAAA